MAATLTDLAIAFVSWLIILAGVKAAIRLDVEADA